MRLAPALPEPATLHAMVVATEGRGSQALTLLRQVERKHPDYAKAWLLDGLIASKIPKEYTRALTSWRRFLALEPKSPVSASVRRWIADLQKSRQPRR
jgi:hypothetical protein